MTAARRAVLPGALAIACIIVYRHALRTWFFFDDFAWLGLPLSIHSAGDLWAALFAPRAQGTVRVLSERLPFLLFSSLFGINPWPFRILTFVTQFANLTLVPSIAKKLTGSTLAGVAAAVFWLFCEALTTPMAWAAGYNEILWAFLLLLSFYFLLRYVETDAPRYWRAQWIAYLIGFGALELNVVYPVIALTYAVLFSRRLVAKAVWLFVPALVFTGLHFAIAPPMADPTYRMYFDSELFRTFYRLLSWSLGPVRMGERVDPRLTTLGYAITAAIALALLAFTIARALKRDRLPLFLIAWFVITIAPLVPLKNHVTDYYPAVAAIGLAMLGGYGFASAWNSRVTLRAAAVALAALYCWGNYTEIRAETLWRRTHSHRLEAVLHAAARIHAASPRAAVLLDGVDWDMFSIGFSDSPFRLFGMPEVFILPPAMEWLEKDPTPLRNLEMYRISEQDAHSLLARGEAIALSLGNGMVVDTTARYRAVYAATPIGERSRVNAGDPSHAPNLGGDWYGIENGYRWMGKTANVRLAGPRSKGQHLAISGYAPRIVLASGPLHLDVSVDGLRVGQLSISAPDQVFTAGFPLPDAVVDKPGMTVQLSVDRTVTPPGDNRRLGVIFGRFEVR